MITIEITKKFNDACVAELKITDRMTIVAGDSSTGKTHICNMLEERDGSAYNVSAFDHKGRGVKIHYCASIGRFEEVINDESKDYSVVVIDEYVATELNKIENMKIRGLMDKVKKYFIIFQRDDIIKYHIGVNSVMHVKYIDKKYIFENPLRFNDEYSLGNITKCDLILSEDSKSGYQILKHYFQIDDKMSVRKTGGNGNIHKELLKFNKEHNIIVGLDYDKGSWELYYIKTLIEANELDKNKIYFIKMESAEEIICNSNLILNKCPDMKDFVENIENHIDCSFQHRGEYFMTLIQKYFKTNNGNALYTKNNTGCFRRDCTDCTANQCKFRDNTEKKVRLLFCNKYEIQYKLYEYVHNEQ